MLTIFLSDMHIGLNTPTNWYQKSLHQKYLKAILRYIQTNGYRIKDVVILGDWFEYSLYLPNGPIPVSLREIFQANADIFTPARDGDFISCLDSIQGNFRYVNGNHDILVSAKEINKHFHRLSRKRKYVVCDGTPQDNTAYKANGIYAEHGHNYSMISRPDNSSDNLFAPLPVDYYVCRTWTDIVSQYIDCLGEKNSADFFAENKPLFGTGGISLDSLIKSADRRKSFAEVVLYLLVSLATKGKGNPRQYFYLMPDGSRISAAEAAEMFPGPTITKKTLPGLLVDLSRSLTSVGKTFCQQGNKVVLMGHTHIPKIEHCLYMKSFNVNLGIIVNTGFLCPSMKEFNNGNMMTFAEVEQKDGKYYTRLKKVDYPHTTISTMKELMVNA